MGQSKRERSEVPGKQTIEGPPPHWFMPCGEPFTKEELHKHCTAELIAESKTGEIQDIVDIIRKRLKKREMTGLIFEDTDSKEELKFMASSFLRIKFWDDEHSCSTLIYGNERDMKNLSSQFN